MKNIFHLNTIAFTVLFMLIITACTENFLDVTNPNDIVADVTQNPEGMRKIETGMFYFLKTQYNYFWQLWLAECAGEYQFVSNAEEGPENIRIYNLSPFPTDQNLGNVYAGFYSAILNANIIITSINNNTGTISELPPDEKSRILGSAYFVRGWSYFNLLHSWGRPFDGSDHYGVVIDTTVITSFDEFVKPRSRPSEVYALLEHDFKMAVLYLPNTDSLVIVDEPGRPCRASAMAMLGKVYVFQKKYSQAIAEFQQFMTLCDPAGKNHKGLLEYYGDVFHGGTYENSIESLFEIQYFDNTATNPWQGGGSGSSYDAYMAGPNSITDDKGKSLQTKRRGNVDVKDILFQDPIVRPGFPYWNFEKGDIRSFESRCASRFDTITYQGIERVKYDTLNIVSGPYPNGKWYRYIDDPTAQVNLQGSPKKFINVAQDEYNTLNPTYPRSSATNHVLLRVAEIYFLYAEALALDPAGDLNLATELVNRVRRRAFGYFPAEVGSPADYAGNNRDDFFIFLQAEKRKEFIGEQVRWYDMLRWGIAEEECAITGRTFTNSSQAWPIPQKELSANPACEQNP
jgi:hypothetical protein